MSEDISSIALHEAGHICLMLFGGGEIPEHIKVSHIVEDGQPWFQVESLPAPPIERLLHEFVGGVLGELMAGPLAYAGQLHDRIVLSGGFTEALELSPHAEHDAIFVRSMPLHMRDRAVGWASQVLTVREAEFRALAKVLDRLIHGMPKNTKVQIPSHWLLRRCGSAGVH